MRFTRAALLAVIATRERGAVQKIAATQPLLMHVYEIQNIAHHRAKPEGNLKNESLVENIARGAGFVSTTSTVVPTRSMYVRDSEKILRETLTFTSICCVALSIRVVQVPTSTYTYHGIPIHYTTYRRLPYTYL